MQEGILSLMQMPRTTVAVQRLRDAALPYIVVLTHPTTGGVTASYAMLGDIHIAEPGALIGFAGPRVIEQTIREQLPDGFQRAEYLVEHGMVDLVVHRHKMRETLIRICRLLKENPEQNETLFDELLPEEDTSLDIAEEAVKGSKSTEVRVIDESEIEILGPGAGDASEAKHHKADEDDTTETQDPVK